MTHRRAAIAALLSAAVMIGCQHNTGSPRNQTPEAKDSVITIPEKQPAPAPAADTALTDVARVIAGIKPSAASPLAARADLPAWQHYQAISDSVWARFDRDKVAKIREFTDSALAGLTVAPTVFYPFSGPDFLFVHAFLPRASRYILFGMEPSGSAPDIAAVAPDSIGRIVYEAGKAIEEVLSFSFFKTIDMRAELNARYINGTLPIVMLFAVRTGHEIINIRHFSFDSTGSPLYGVASRCSGKACYGKGFELGLLDMGTSNTHTVVYFSCDASNNGMQNGNGVKNFLANLDQGITTYIKAASYLMHKDNFSTVRDVVLAKSDLVVQDDSGIPYRLFDRGIWSVQLFGHYAGPIGMFGKYTQTDLAADYADSARTLGTRLGYLQQSAVQVAARRKVK